MDRPKASHKKFNPNFYHLGHALMDNRLRLIFLYGGSSSSKSFSVGQTFLLEALKGYNTMVFKKTGASITDSIYKTFKEASRMLNISHLFDFKINRIACKINEAEITFKGLDDPEKIKGLESYQYVVCEELSEFDEEDYKQIKKRLRGRDGQKIISTFNPISDEHWIKKNIFDKEVLHDVCCDLYGKVSDRDENILPKEFTEITQKQINSERIVYNPRKKQNEVHPPDMLIIRSTYLNNFWVVGSPCGSYGFYDKQTVADFEKDKVSDPGYYDIYALGLWGKIKTGGEFFHAFNAGKHRRKVDYEPGIPIHVSIDDNRLPYISISFWQYIDGVLSQVHEICASDPFNTVSKAGEMARMWLEDILYDDVVFLHGDASTKKGNTIDDEKRSFLDKFIEQLEVSYTVEDRVPKSNPSVSLSGEFINAILSGALPALSIVINETCSASINDYENVKKDVNGSILKTKIRNKLTKQTYEEHGHLSDTFRYVVCGALSEEYTKFSLRRKRNQYKDEDMMNSYFNADSAIKYDKIITFVMPDCNGVFELMTIGVGESYDVLDVVYRDKIDKSLILAQKPEYYVFECHKSYFSIIREIRELGIEARGMQEHAKVHHRILANEPIVKSKVRFRSDYEENEDYLSFMNNVLDYNGKDNYEALNLLSMAVYHIERINA